MIQFDYIVFFRWVETTNWFYVARWLDERPRCPDRCSPPFGVYRVSVILIQVGRLDLGEWHGLQPKESRDSIEI